MQFDTSTPRNARTIAGFALQVIAPFKEGDTLTSPLADILNQTIAENFSNNLRAKLAAGKLDAEGKPSDPPVPYSTEEAQAMLDTYMAEYEPGVRRGGGGEPRVSDPVEREARKIARAKAAEFVRSKGLKTSEVDMGDITTKLFDKYRDNFMAEGKKIVAAQEKAKRASEELSFDGIEL